MAFRTAVVMRAANPLNAQLDKEAVPGRNWILDFGHFAIPVEADLETVQCKYENGIVTILRLDGTHLAAFAAGDVTVPSSIKLTFANLSVILKFGSFLKTIQTNSAKKNDGVGAICLPLSKGPITAIGSQVAYGSGDTDVTVGSNAAATASIIKSFLLLLKYEQSMGDIVWTNSAGYTFYAANDGIVNGVQYAREIDGVGENFAVELPENGQPVIANLTISQPTPGQLAAAYTYDGDEYTSKTVNFSPIKITFPFASGPIKQITATQKDEGIDWVIQGAQSGFVDSLSLQTTGWKSGFSKHTELSTLLSVFYLAVFISRTDVDGETIGYATSTTTS